MNDRRLRSKGKNFTIHSHTLKNIWLALERYSSSDPEAAETMPNASFAEYLRYLDAINWQHRSSSRELGTCYGDEQVENRWNGISLPHPYDHASSLGRELRDERRDRLMAENRVGDYAERGRGAIYWSEDERHGPSPLELSSKRAAPTLIQTFFNQQF